MVSDVAYFGINEVNPHIADRDRKPFEAEVAAFDLAAGRLLWRRRVPSKGMLNVVAAPQLGELSTSLALQDWSRGASLAAWAAATASAASEAARRQQQHG